MVTRILKYLRQRADFLSQHGHRGPETNDVAKLIKELETIELLDANPTKQRKWFSADTWLPAGCVLTMIEDEQLAKK